MESSAMKAVMDQVNSRGWISKEDFLEAAELDATFYKKLKLVMSEENKTGLYQLLSEGKVSAEMVHKARSIKL